MLKDEKKSQKNITHLLNGFSKLNYRERLVVLNRIGFLTRNDINELGNPNPLSLDLADHFIENVIGTYPLPLGVAVNFIIDGCSYILPMAVEETSIIAAASKTAKWIRDHGEITTKTISQHAIGQVQISRVKNFEKLTITIETHKKKLIEMLNTSIAHTMNKRGGGVRDITVRKILRGDGHHMAVIHLMIDTCDAMGANAINMICEYFKDPIEKLTEETVNMCILSNLTDTKVTQAQVIIRNINPKLGNAIQEASLFAQIDPYRAATNNKGVLNAIDGILIATGNDWRAVEAGIHAYAARSGTYSSITKWQMLGKDLHGVLEAPINVGIVGGVTKLHPTARLCLKILGVKSAHELSRIVAAAGLVENLAALRALVSEGITQGHMKLHLANLAMAAGATKEEFALINDQLKTLLSTKKYITSKDLSNIIEDFKKNKHVT